MVSCEHPDVLLKTFQKLAIDASTVERLNQKISEALPSMQQQNIETKNTVQSLWNNYTNEVAQLNKQIEEEIQKIKQKTQTLNNYIVDFFPNGIVASDLSDSIKKLTNQIYLKEQAINDTIRLLSSQKIFHPNQRKFSTSNNQTENEAITIALIEQSNQIESELSTSTAYTEITTVYNKQTEDVKKAQTTYSYGNINQLWAFIVPTEDEFILHLFVRRDVSKSQESPSKNTISTYRINLSVNNYSNIAKLKGSGTNYADGSIVPISIELTSNEYTFEGWYDESYKLISSNNSCKVAINGRSRTITARISKKTLATNYDTDNSSTTTEQPTTPSKYYPPATTKTPPSTSADERIIENMEDILVGKWICTNDNYYKGMIIEIKKDFNSDEYVGKVIELRSDAYTIIQGRRFVRSSNNEIRLSSFKWRKITFVSNDQLDYFEAKVLKRDGSYVRGIIKFLNDETIQVSDNSESGIEIYKQLKFK
ncbi:MAG: hypothetical protein LC115_09880 [Bacteroidia bacterium]|nr:hypothetical protein [Bacteroidia bacterium]